LPYSSPRQNLLGLARSAAARRHGDSQLARRKELRDHPGRRTALPKPGPPHRRSTRNRTRCALRGPGRDDAPEASDSSPRPRAPRRDWATAKPRCPHGPSLWVDEPMWTGPARQRRGWSAAVL